MTPASTREVRAYLRIEGRVQGVFYRGSMNAEARALGVCGWVRNQPDGSVEAVAEGPRHAVDRLIVWARQGPPGALVTAVHIAWEESRGEFTNFATRR